MIERTIEVERMEHVISVFGSFDRNLSIIESELGVKVLDRENKIHICGEEESVMLAEKAINGLLTLAARGENIDAQSVRYILKLVAEGRESKINELASDVVCITAKGKPVKAKTLGQKTYCDAIANNTITLGIGPAGTQRTVDLGPGDIAFEREIGIRFQPGHALPDRFGRVRRDDGHIDVVHLGRYGEPEQEQLHDGNAQHDEHRARIAHDMQRLLPDERQETSHATIRFVWRRGPASGTPRPSTPRQILSSVRRVRPAHVSARPP